MRLEQWFPYGSHGVSWPSVGSALLVMLMGSVIYFIWNWASDSGDFGRRRRGPKSYPILGAQIEISKNLNNLYAWATSYLEKDPTHTIRVRRPLSSSYVVITANPENVEHMLKTNFDNYPKGATVLEGLRPLLGHGIFNADGDMWKSQRKVASHEFSTRTLRDFVVEFVHNETHERLLPVLAEAHADGRVIDIQDVFLRFAFDNICLLGFGYDLGCLDPSFPEVEFANAFDEAMVLTFKRVLLPQSLYTIVSILARFGLVGDFGIGAESKLVQHVQIIDKFALALIQKRREELQSRTEDDDKSELDIADRKGTSKFSQGQSDLLSRFIQFDDEVNAHDDEAEQKRKDRAPSDKYLRDILINFVIAGRDTSSLALTWFFWLLPQYPGVEQAIEAEVTSILRAKGKTAADGFDFDDLKEMHYVQAAITESMRLYPPVPTDSKTALADDRFPDGTVIGKGDRVVFHCYAMGRMQDLWGPDCLEFKPERFLHDGKFVPASSFKYPIFQAGPRICMGKEMAYTQMKYIIASVISSPYRFKLSPGAEKLPASGLSLTFKMRHGLKGTVHKV
ncbi:protein MpCYP94L1 [Marchantia polymorpha subsp. ruderalis]|nr:hypothetical protein MARPO_0141s0021 [Marchantia polymorpha]BBN10512.1 hypothetical protein Mp_5g04140 [Marchantia polymorpha subsp. ruderalis]|eukprot:PTQ29441.1 hypothetical protein MARPO_0141s0021 [Marchantia polymorpha]